jgi:hypothetical protein
MLPVVAVGRLPFVAVAKIGWMAEGVGKGISVAVGGWGLGKPGKEVAVGTGDSSIAVTVANRFDRSSGSGWLSWIISPMIPNST